MTITPAMQQYYDIKEKYKDSILFFRMGDFYEMFEDDAQIAHKILGIALTTRNKNAENPVLLAGIPYHAKEKYLPLLVNAGYKVAIAEQVSDPKAKGIVEREVQRVVTPGTLSLEGEAYEGDIASNIIVSIAMQEDMYGISVINFSDHSWICSEFNSVQDCASQLYKLSPAEVILEKKLYENKEIHEILSKKYKLNIYYKQFDDNPYDALRNRFGTKNLIGFGIEEKKTAQLASALLIEYIKENQKSSLNFLNSLSYESFSGYMDLDDVTIKSLDLVFNYATNSKSMGTLLGVLDHSKTAMGKRYLRQQILHPLQSIKQIQQRQKFIAACKQDPIILSQLRDKLRYIIDLDMLLTRLSLERVGPRDFLRLKDSLIAIRDIIDLIESSENTQLKKILS